MKAPAVNAAVKREGIKNHVCPALSLFLACAVLQWRMQ